MKITWQQNILDYTYCYWRVGHPFGQLRNSIHTFYVASVGSSPKNDGNHDIIVPVSRSGKCCYSVIDLTWQWTEIIKHWTENWGHARIFSIDSHYAWSRVELTRAETCIPNPRLSMASFKQATTSFPACSTLCRNQRVIRKCNKNDNGKREARLS